MGEDPVQESMGDMGRWQIPTIIMMFIYKLPLAWHTMAIIFLGPKVDVECLTPNVTDPCSLECTERVYNRTVFTNTIIMEWDLVCDRKHLASIAQATVMLGILIGSMVFGIVADRFGRRLPLYTTVVLLIITGLITSFVKWFWLFNILRFFNAFAIGGGMIISFVCLMEIIGKPYREPLGIGYQVPYWTGHLTLTVFSYFLRDWRDYQLSLSLASLIAVPILIIVSESPRWLFATGQLEKAAEVLKKAAKVNKLPTDEIEQNLQTLQTNKRAEQTEKIKRAKVWDLFRTPNLRLKTLVISYAWLACGMGYYGIVQFAGYLGKDVFVSVAVSAALEVPGTLICIFLTKYWGRKPTMILPNLITGCCMITIAFLPKDSDTAIILLVSLGTAGMTMAFSNAYLYAGELFPTVVRNVGMGVASMAARIGAILSPFIANLDQLWLSSIIFGIIPLIAAGLCFLLPETKGQPLPETIQDGEMAGKKKKINS